MKLYHFPGTCSLAPHIVACEAGLALDLEKVDITATPHLTEAGLDYATINPNGYVPALQLDDGTILTEVAAIVQFLADQRPETGLVPAADSYERYNIQAWLTFISSELHKTFSPWLFNPDYGDEPKRIARQNLTARFGFLDQHLAGDGYLNGAGFSVADAYGFTIVGWSRFFGIDLTPWPNLSAWMDRVASRPKVREAMQAEGLMEAV